MLVPSLSNDFLAISSLSLFCFLTSSLNIFVIFDNESLLLPLENDFSVFRFIICLSKVNVQLLTKNLIDMLSKDDCRVFDLHHFYHSYDLANYQTKILFINITDPLSRFISFLMLTLYFLIKFAFLRAFLLLPLVFCDFLGDIPKFDLCVPKYQMFYF